MRLLIDTQVLLWFIQDDPQLPDNVRAMIVDPENEVCVSIASYWEIGIKQKAIERKINEGKKPVGAEAPWKSSVQALERLAHDQVILTLPVTTDAIEHTKSLPMDHRDPFDRIIAASAVTAGLRLVSSDAAMDVFVVDRLWA